MVENLKEYPCAFETHLLPRPSDSGVPAFHILDIRYMERTVTATDIIHTDLLNYTQTYNTCQVLFRDDTNFDR